MTTNTEPSGVLLLCKPKGVTSHDMVAKIRKIYGTRRVGHTGTLDPMATGVLVLLVGRAAKAAEYLAVHDKCYVADLQLGLTTDTEDITGNTLTTSDKLPTTNEVIDAVAKYKGVYMQTPPMYSALKINGQKLLDLARRGVTVERQARPVTIHNITVLPTSCPHIYTLSVNCSAGTYIRTLCADIGRDLGCGGVMAALHRTKTGHFSIDSCHTPDEIEAMTATERETLLLPIETLFNDLPLVSLPAFFERLARGGCEIYQKKIGTAHAIGERVRVANEKGNFFALGEVREYTGGSAIKLIKTFVL